MTAEDLKKSILQQAIQSKLVPQSPDDEPASVLLDRIRAEKARLVAEGKIKRDKNESVIYRNDDGQYIESIGGVEKDITDEIPFEIPENWEWERWGNISFNIQYGYNAPAQQEGDIKMVRISDIQDGKILWSSVPFCNIPSNEIPNYLLKKNDILFARTGGTVGKSYIVKETPCSAIYAGYLIRTQYSDDICSMYMKFFMESQLYWSQLRDGTIATAQPNCNGKTLGKMLVPLPPLAEQKRIVAKIEELMPIVEEYGKAQSRLDELNSSLGDNLRKSVLQYAIQGKLVPQSPDEEPASVLLDRIRAEKARLIAEGKIKRDKNESVIYRNDEGQYIERIGKTEKDISDEIPHELPNSWEWCRIGDIFFHNNGKQLNKSNKSGVMMDYITTSNLYWDGFRLDNLNQMPFEPSEIERCQALKGDLLVCEGGDVGRSCIWNYDYPIMLQNHIHKLRGIIPVETKYFYYIFLLYNLKGTIGGKGIGIQGFSAKALHNTIIPLPPLAEQKRIVERIDQILSLYK